MKTTAQMLEAFEEAIIRQTNMTNQHDELTVLSVIHELFKRFKYELELAEQREDKK